MSPIIYRRRAAPVDMRKIDLTTVSELARVLEDRLAAVAAFGGCSTCHDAEARAFLAQFREMLVRDGV